MIVIMIITTINHNNHNNWNPYYIHKIIIPSSPLHTTNCSPQLPCLEWRHCDLLANQRPQSLKENPQGRVFSPCGGVLFFVPNFCWCPKKKAFFSPRKKCWKLREMRFPTPNSVFVEAPPWVPGGHVQIPPILRGKNKSLGCLVGNSWDFSWSLIPIHFFWHPKNVVICKNPWEVV